MSRTNLEPLAEVIDTQYRVEEAGFRRVVDEERRLRAMLDDLNEKERAARDALRTDSAMRSFGGDALWFTWMARNRVLLNARLANILARKEASQARLKKANGRVLAAKDIRDSARETQKNARTAQQLSVLLEQMTWR
ncbi:hypothetical protein SAMN04490248_101252 [Salinihabitans flavidus]|uniref:Flagellar export protein FliJ n=1 Tax=Salinihabitans flavidus TaxID=569882 RepID=A0A1H8LRG1_9RHOB|nr:hypothetical protein [Salinihabitans flavidus]SEO07448.1 hypothetical protein SAMN04490248_101252 [Salinihabitans flavidus]